MKLFSETPLGGGGVPGNDGWQANGCSGGVGGGAIVSSGGIGGAAASGAIRFYVDSLFLVIDGNVQSDETKVDVRYGGERTRVYVRWNVPTNGLEWDGRGKVGTARRFGIAVFGPKTGEAVLRSAMSLVWFAVGHRVGERVFARAIFESGATPLPGESSKPATNRNPFGY
jgi:hypothetical protein